MNTSEVLKQIAEHSAESCFTDSYKKPENLAERMNSGLGIAIAAYCEWCGLEIMEIFEAALEDANFHTEAAQVSEMIEREKSQ